MNCSKCNQPMKAYLGLKETGWDCVNPDCGKTPILGEYYYEYNFVDSDSPAIDISGSAETDNNGILKIDFSKLTVKLPGALKSTTDATKGHIAIDTDDTVLDAIRYMADALRADLEKSLELLPMIGLSAQMDEYFSDTACGSDLDNWALHRFGIQRYFDETDEDFRFRLKASLDT